MQSEPTTFEETIIKNHTNLPSITFCVDLWQDNFTSFQDILDAIELEKIKANSLFFAYGRNIEREWIDLKNSSLLDKRFNLSFNDLWSFMATVSPWHGSKIIICSSLNSGLLKLPAQVEKYYFSVFIDVCLDQIFGVRFERHEPQQSLYNFQFDMNKGYQYFERGKTQFSLVIPVETEALKQRKYDCHEDNSMKITDCVDEYIAEQLNCSLPWTRPYKDFRICSGSEELANFRTIHSKISSKQSMENLEKKGCFKPNCLQTNWKDSYISQEKQAPNCTNIQIGQQSDSYTIRRKEILLADFSTFVVDCGSYFGLFLGASILSLTDTALAYILKAGVTFFRK